MAIEIVKSSQDKNGYTKDNVVTLILDKAEDIKAAGTDYDPGSFAYTADMTGCWQLNTEHEWILVDGSSAMTLSYEAQELTDVQKNQARANIGAQEVLVGTAGQMVGFNEDGVAVAQEAPSGVTSWNDLEDRPFGESYEWNEVFPEQEITGADQGGGMLGNAIQPGVLSGDENKIKVTFDGKQYECTVFVADETPYYGNLSMMGLGDDTGEPFLIISAGSYMTAIVMQDTNAHIVAISALQTIIKPIGAKYLPGLDVYLSPSEFGTGNVMYLYKDVTGVEKLTHADIEQAVTDGAPIRVRYSVLGLWTPIQVTIDDTWATVWIIRETQHVNTTAGGSVYVPILTTLYTAEYTPTT